MTLSDAIMPFYFFLVRWVGVECFKSVMKKCFGVVFCGVLMKMIGGATNEGGVGVRVWCEGGFAGREKVENRASGDRMGKDKMRAVQNCFKIGAKLGFGNAVVDEKVGESEVFTRELWEWFVGEGLCVQVVEEGFVRGHG